MDTGGLDLFPETDLWQQVKAQIELAIDEADVIIFAVDAETGLTPADMDVAEALRLTDKPIVLAVNKADNDRRAADAVEFYALNAGDPIPVSAYHNLGVDELMAQVTAHFPSAPAFPEPDADLKLAIIGRPNVGKSMLLNAIAGERRAIVSDIPGTTRDSLDSLLRFDDWSVLLIDTAGIRRRGRIERGIERYSVLRAIRAIDRADVAVLLMDASELASSQDTHIAKYILEEFKGIILAVNKWDLASEIGLTQNYATQQVRTALQVRFIRPHMLHIGAERQRHSQFAGHRAAGVSGMDEGRAALRFAPPRNDRRSRASARAVRQALAQNIQRGAGQHRPAEFHILRQPFGYGAFLIQALLGERAQGGIRISGQSAANALQGQRGLAARL